MASARIALLSSSRATRISFRFFALSAALPGLRTKKTSLWPPPPSLFSSSHSSRFPICDSCDLHIQPRRWFMATTDPAESSSLSTPRPLDRSDHCFRFIHRLLIFFLGHGVGDDSGSGLDVAFFAFEEQGAAGDAAVSVAGEVGVEDAASVNAAAGGFELFDDLHGADLGRAGERAGGEAGAEGVDWS